MSVYMPRVNGVLISTELHRTLENTSKVRSLTFMTQFPLSENGDISSFLLAKSGMDDALDEHVVTADILARGFIPETSELGVKLTGVSFLNDTYVISSVLRRDSVKREVLVSSLRGRKNLTLSFTVDIESIIKQQHTMITSPTGIMFKNRDIRPSDSVEHFPNIFTTSLQFPYFETEEVAKRNESNDLIPPVLDSDFNIVEELTPDAYWSNIEMSVVLQEVLY